MAEEKGIGSKIFRLFVEPGAEDAPNAEDAGEKSAADEVAELARHASRQSSLHGPPASSLKFDPSGMAPSSSGVADFGEIFREAGMDPSELDRVTKAEDLLRQLPSTIGHAEKRAIVEASLKAFGFEIEKIVGAAQNQRRALDAYVKVNETATAKAITDAEAQIKAFDQKIASLRAEIEKRTAALASLARQAQARKAEVDKVLEFFQGPSSPQR